ncbi:MAG: transporter [Pseudonocardiales bacterium]|nr:transporter [Pseudonocardiales bacterium]
MRQTAVGTRSVPRSVALTTVLAVLFLTFLDTTIVTVALGNIQFDLGAGVIPLQWVVNAYSLVFASLMLIAGSLSDRLGRKWVMVIGIVIFCAGSVLCALAPNIGTLIGGRAVMGVGAAASEPGTLSVIRHLYPDRAQRARALGAWAAVSGLSLALGPVIGGLLVGVGDWRTVFWFNLALGALLLVAAIGYVPDSADPQPGRLDVGGFFLGAVMLGSLIYAGISGEQYGYGTTWIVALFVLGGLSLIALVIVERRARSPMLDARYLKAPAVSGALFVAFAVYFGVFSIFFFTALYLDIVVGYSGWQMAGVFAPMAAAIVIGSVISGFWVGFAGPRGPMLLGCVLSAGGILFTRHYLDANPAFGALAVVLALAGLGFGIAVVPLTAAVLGYVPAALSGMAASATNTARQLGAVVGVTALGALVNAHITNDFGASLTQSGITGGGKDFIVKLLETGGKDAAGIDIAHPSPLIKPLVDAATAAFRTGLHAALLVSAALILLSALVIALVPRSAIAPDTEFD